MSAFDVISREQFPTKGTGITQSQHAHLGAYPQRLDKVWQTMERETVARFNVVSMFHNLASTITERQLFSHLSELFTIRSHRSILRTIPITLLNTLRSHKSSGSLPESILIQVWACHRNSPSTVRVLIKLLKYEQENEYGPSMSNKTNMDHEWEQTKTRVHELEEKIF